MEQLLQKTGDQLLGYGLPGIAIIGLIYLTYLLRADLRDERAARQLERAERDKLILTVQEARIAEARAGYEIIRSIQTTQDAIIGALKGR